MTSRRRARARGLLLGLITACSGGTGSGDTESDPGASSTGPATGSTSPTQTDTGDSSGECNLWEQDCSNPAEKCSPWSESPLDGTPDLNLCCPLADPARAIGDDCTMAPPYGSCEDDCEEGATCVVDVIETLTGVCQRLCDPDGDDCAADQICKVFFEAMEDTQEVPLCSDTCDPLSQDCPRAGWVCMPEVPSLGGGGGYICVPPPIGLPKDLGDPCDLGNACGPGGVCAAAIAVPGCTDTGCCTRYCDLTETDADGKCHASLTGTICVAQGSEDPQWVDVGVCALP